MAGKPFDVVFVLAVRVGLERQVQVFMGQVETVLLGQHAAHVDALALAVDVRPAERHTADGEPAQFVIADLPVQPLAPDPTLFEQPFLGRRQGVAGRHRVVLARG